MSNKEGGAADRLLSFTAIFIALSKYMSTLASPKKVGRTVGIAYSEHPVEAVFLVTGRTLKSASAPSMLPSSTIHDHCFETGQPSRYTTNGCIFPTASGGNYRQCAVLPSVRIVGVYSLTEKILYMVFELKVKNYFSQQ